MGNILNKLKQYALAGAALSIGWFLLVFKLRGDKIAKLEAKGLVSDETAKQEQLDKDVAKAREDYNERD